MTIPSIISLNTAKHSSEIAWRHNEDHFKIRARIAFQVLLSELVYLHFFHIFLNTEYAAVSVQYVNGGGIFYTQQSEATFWKLGLAKMGKHKTVLEQQ